MWIMSKPIKRLSYTKYHQSVVKKIVHCQIVEWAISHTFSVRIKARARRPPKHRTERHRMESRFYASFRVGRLNVAHWLLNEKKQSIRQLNFFFPNLRCVCCVDFEENVSKHIFSIEIVCFKMTEIVLLLLFSSNFFFLI